MKSIKEKAEEYGYTNWQSDEYHDGASEGLEFDPIGHTQKTFEAGANYVLDEVECILEDNKLQDCEEKCNELIALVEQLKK
jgi:hypothetical protein